MNNVHLIAGCALNNQSLQYVGSLSTIQSQQQSELKCPCSTTNGCNPLPSIGNNYYCESANPAEQWMSNKLFTNNKLQDGLECEGTCCSSTMTPPWFSVQLPAPTTDMIEVSICADESTDYEGFGFGLGQGIELLKIYVQQCSS